MSWLSPEWVSAIGTTVAALVTIPLWVVSWRAANAARRSADAADLSARAAMWIELPLITGELGNMLHVGEAVPENGSYGGQVIDDIPDRFGAITELALRNHGRSVARLELVRVGHFLGATLPGEPNFSRSYQCDQNMVITPGEVEGIDLSYTVEVSPDQRIALVANEIAIWMYAEITYRDFLDTIRRCGMAWSYTQMYGEGMYFFQPLTTEEPKFRFRI
ncbi:hypothetical protein [Sphingomonas sp. GC_Shp_3]|uniref:hypothetical protein n=1 Tax=Sphingomonas sp. GC_Shp_3 TaxID=2937383 RepID=UPI00226A3065|nr:hypothetical protein [Sphingomonas sp. GC_Shp_3]